MGPVDYIVIGEGEETFIELLKAIEKKSDLSKVRGIAFRKNGKAIMTKPRPLIEDLDSLPFPAYHLFPSLDKYNWYVPHPHKKGLGIMTSRGCPFNCIYCYKGLFGYKWRARSPENVVAEWEWLVKEVGVEEIAIYDDIFNLSMDRANKIYDLLIKKGLAIPHFFPNGIRAEYVDLPLLKKMKKAGCIRIAFGVETGSKRIMQAIDKRLDFDKVRKAFKLCDQLGIETTAFFVLGLPGETRETMQQTIDFAKELNPTFAQFTTLTPFVGTRVYDLIKKEGKLLENWNVKFSSHFDKPKKFELGEVTPELLEEMKRKAYREFYFRPAYLLKNLRPRNLCWDNVKRIFHYSS
jgi:anaerobic magnesium-protoporphyrin IX monomethyl ester cyclase